MDIRLTEDQRAIADNVAKVCSEFDDNYWSGCCGQLANVKQLEVVAPPS